MARLYFSGEWHPNWGAAPGEVGCTIPADVIAEAARAKRNSFAFGKRGMSKKTKTKADHLILAEPLGKRAGPLHRRFPKGSWGAAG
jgi:hypothetical protein